MILVQVANAYNMLQCVYREVHWKKVLGIVSINNLTTFELTDGYSSVNYYTSS